MPQFKTPNDYACAVLPFLSPLSHNPHYLHSQAVNETIEACMATEHADILKEISDCLFYYLLPAIALPHEVMPLIDLTHDEWTSNFPHPEDEQSPDAARREALENAALFGGMWAKSIREPDSKIQRILKMEQYGRTVLLALKDLANAHGASLADIAALNYAKLADRKARGVLLGDGSSR
jgi:hypothetical protein